LNRARAEGRKLNRPSVCDSLGRFLPVRFGYLGHKTKAVYKTA
jgi:hypothetical protein